MQEIVERLDRLPLEDLRRLSRLLNRSGLPRRAAELRQALGEALRSESWPGILARLSDPEKTALAMAAHHPTGSFDRPAFRARHAQEPPDGFWLRLLLREGRLPPEARRALQELLPAPPAAALTCCDRPPDGLKVVETEDGALRSLGPLLHLAGLGRLKPSPRTGHPTAATVRAVLEVLPGGDLVGGDISRATDSIRPFGWLRLLRAGGCSDRPWRCPARASRPATARRTKSCATCGTTT
ncbi:MAG: hypothetical protein AB1758_23450 [Candidatus Eremiobacterota bacterium]